MQDFNIREYKPPKGTTLTVTQWIIVGTIATLVLIVAVYAIRWLKTPLDLTDPARIQELSRDANQHYQSLESSLASIDALNKKMANIVTTYGEDRSTWPQGKADEYLQLDAQRVNLVTAYNKLCGDYRAKWNNEWYDLPAPDDLPKTCEMTQ